MDSAHSSLVTSSRTGGNRIKPYLGMFRLDSWKKFFTETLVKSLEQAPKGSGQDLKPVRVPRNTWSMSYGLVLCSSAKTRELDLMVLMCPFQLEIFCDCGSLSKSLGG